MENNDSKIFSNHKVDYDFGPFSCWLWLYIIITLKATLVYIFVWGHCFVILDLDSQVWGYWEGYLTIIKLMNEFDFVQWSYLMSIIDNNTLLTSTRTVTNRILSIFTSRAYFFYDPSILNKQWVHWRGLRFNKLAKTVLIWSYLELD